MAGRGSVDASELCRRLELSASQAIIRLTKLELLGDVRQTATGYAATRAGPA
jgi:predicted Rossmann fold nucleotide-binding protein DprA/Smf involved in DNA uptake